MDVTRAHIFTRHCPICCIIGLKLSYIQYVVIEHSPGIGIKTMGGGQHPTVIDDRASTENIANVPLHILQPCPFLFSAIITDSWQVQQVPRLAARRTSTSSSICCIVTRRVDRTHSVDYNVGLDTSAPEVISLVVGEGGPVLGPLDLYASWGQEPTGPAAFPIQNIFSIL
jgi:hypothetical protein